VSRRLPRYPIAFAVGFVVLLIVVSGVSPFAAIRTLLVTAVLAGAMVVSGTWLLGDEHRGGIAAALAILAVMGGDVRIVVVVVIAFALMLVERYGLKPDRRTIRWPRIGLIASRLVAIMLLAITIQAVQLGAVGLVVRAALRETALRPANDRIASTGDPDIYMILVDGHTRLDVGESLLGIDPAPLREGLTSRGFEIAERSRSNYTLTAEVLSSMFEQAQLPDIERMKPLVAGTSSRPAGAVVHDVINDNRTFGFLRARGYEVHAISPGFEEVTIREADRFVDTGQINEFEIGMLRRSMLGDLLTILAPDAASAQQRDRLRDIFQALIAAPGQATDRPAFVFAHVPSPHAPWVFNADGSDRTVADLDAFYAETPASTGLTNDELGIGYAGQVVDIDRRLLSSLDQLDLAIAARGRPAVTVVFSDHGTWIGADGGDIRLRFKDLLAVRSTGPDVHVEPDLTLVNLLPSLFEQLFSEPWVRRPDTTYAFGPRDSFDLRPVDDPDAGSRP
jgi:hypothetical protein